MTELRAALFGEETAMFDDLARWVNQNEALVRRGRYVTLDFLIESGSDGYLVRIVEGAVKSVTEGPFVMPNWTFALRAPREAWETFLQPRPPAGFTTSSR